MHHKYDIIGGPVANDKVFDVVNLYLAGVYDKPEALKRLKYFKSNNQVVFATEKALSKINLFREVEA